MSSNLKIFALLFVVLGCSLVSILATVPSGHQPQPPQTIVIKPPPRPPTGGTPGTCPVPTEEMLRCLRQYACQYIIRLDLRCLLNLNGNPLLGGVLGGGGAPPAGGTGAGNGGLLGGILGL